MSLLPPSHGRCNQIMIMTLATRIVRSMTLYVTSVQRSEDYLSMKEAGGKPRVVSQIVHFVRGPRSFA
jgi:hypothetical protein